MLTRPDWGKETVRSNACANRRIGTVFPQNDAEPGRQRLSGREDQKMEAIPKLKDSREPCQSLTDPSTSTRSVVGGGGSIRIWGKAGRAGLAGSLLRGVLSAKMLPGSTCKEGKHYSALLLIISVLKGFLGLSRRQIWQEVSQALSWQL